MLKVAQLINALRRIGGAERLQLIFAEAVVHHDVDLTVITLSENDAVIKDQIELAGSRVETFPGRKLVNPVRFWKLLRFVREEKFDVIHTHLTMSNIIGTLLGRFSGIPVVTSLHNTKMASQKHPIHGPLETWLLRRSAQRIIAVGWGTAAAHQARLEDKPIAVIPNAVAAVPKLCFSERSKLRIELVGNSDYKLLINVGRLTEQKGFHDLLEAFAIVNQSFPNTRLLIVGAGDLKTELEDKILELKLANTVKMLGLRDDVHRLLAASDLYVSSSHWEGLPVSILEAMSAALPIVATSVGDVPRVVVDGAGILVPPKKPTEIAAAIQSYLGDPTRMRNSGEAALAHVNKTFNSDSWAKKILDVYTSILPDYTDRGLKSTARS